MTKSSGARPAGRGRSTEKVVDLAARRPSSAAAAATIVDPLSELLSTAEGARFAMEHPEIAAADRLAYCARSRLRDLCNPRLTDGQRRRWILQVTRALRCMVDMPPDTNQELRLHVFFRSLSYTGLGLREGGEPKRTKATFVRMAKDFGSDLAAKHSGASDRAVLLAARAWARMSRGGQIAWSPIVALAAEVGFSMTAESLRTSLPARHYKAIVTRAINRSTARAGNAEPS